MFLEATQAMEDGAAIVLTWVSVVITIVLAVIVLLIIRKNIKIAKEEHDIIVENAITKRAMVDSIKQYIKKVDRFGAMTLISVDVDGFADVNEVFGEKTGDQLLKEMAARILRVLPYKASLCKYDGDEFLIFIKDEDNRSRIEKVANQILDAVNSQYQIIIGENITLTASLGLVTYPVAGSTFEELYTNLELTTYVSKRDGGNKFTSYYASISDDEMDNMAYYREVKHAITNKEFVLYYQPMVNLYDKTIIGAECLMRWNHPTKGVQAPNTFLKVLEQSGDIKWVGEWGVEAMIRIHKQLKEKYPTIPLTFSLNLSTKQLLNPELANSFIALMNKHNARADNFMLEISEFQMVEKLATIKTNIYKLRDFGFKIAVDAFDLDGQSVQTITRSPMDVIKLGRSFLRDIDNNFMKEKLLQILIKYSIDNSKMLISEGIETAIVAKYVKNQTIRYGQGYYFAKPMSYEAFEEYIERREYKRLLDEVTRLEETDEFRTIHEDAEDAYEESPDELLNRIVREKQQQS